MKRPVVLVLLAVTVLVMACQHGPKKTCWVNQVCFTCPDEKEQAKCIKDPASARCKWAPASECK